MTKKDKSQKRIPNEPKDNYIGFWVDNTTLKTITELKIKLDMDTDALLMRYAIKKLQREHILNSIEVA